MIDNIKIQYLSAKRYPVICRDKLLIYERIKYDHVFSSIDEAIEYLYYIIKNQSINPDDVLFKSYKDKSLLVINIIDEAICSIIKDLYSYISRSDQDAISYASYKIMQFYNDLNHEINKSINKELLDQSTKEMCFTLLLLLLDLDYLANPSRIPNNEEVEPFRLARSYYSLMYQLYKNATPYDDYYRLLENKYKELLEFTIKSQQTVNNRIMG